MAERPAKHPPLDPEKSALLRRARRRLVGAVALALVVVLLVPMLFDPEPATLGPEVEIDIPEPDSPFETEPAPATPRAPPPAPEASQAAPSASPQAAPQADPQPAPRPAPVAHPPEVARVPAQPPRPASKPEARAAPKPETKAETKPGPKAEPKPDPRPDPRPEAKAAGGAGVVLQLGAFSKEANALALRDKARAAGFAARVMQAQGQYRVRIGPFESRDEAARAESRLRAKGFAPALIAP